MFGGSKKKNSGSQFDTLIAQGTEITGDLILAGGLHIDGKIEGQIKAADDNQQAIVRLSEEGEVIGDILAPHIIINGKVHGDVYSSEHIELAPKASITGNVYYNLIEMAMGAEVNGNLVHQKDAQHEVKDTMHEDEDKDTMHEVKDTMIVPLTEAPEAPVSSGEQDEHFSVNGSIKVNS
jgi:cytoskeletal protein CcmA (bactofilin family)